MFWTVVYMHFFLVIKSYVVIHVWVVDNNNNSALKNRRQKEVSLDLKKINTI